jgi:hypothetical protein
VDSVTNVGLDMQVGSAFEATSKVGKAGLGSRETVVIYNHFFSNL